MRKNNRERILDTARRLLPKHGYNGVSIRAIAQRAKLTTGAIYFHFRDKKEIYRTICFEAIDILMREFRERIRQRRTPSQKLISIFDSYIDFFYRHRERYNILMEYKADYQAEQGCDDAIMRRMSEMTGIMEDTIRSGIEEGSFRGLDPRKLALLLFSVAEGMLQVKKLGLFDHLGVSDGEFRSFMADVIGNGIMKKD